MRFFWQQSGCSKQATLTEYGKQRWSDYGKNECNRVPRCFELLWLTTISDKTNGKSSGFLLHVIDYLAEIYCCIYTYTHSPPKFSYLVMLPEITPSRSTKMYLFLSGVTDPEVRKDVKSSPKISTWEVCLEQLRCNCSDPCATNTAPYLLLRQRGNNP